METALVTILGKEEIQYIGITPPLMNLRELCEWLKAVPVVDHKEDVKRIFSVKAFDDYELLPSQLGDVLVLT